MAPKLSEHGQQLVSSLASRTGFSPEAVRQLLLALQRGNGTMAQFSHPELGGSGQWARGGMLMIGDMFNDALKARVSALATELASALVAGSPAPTQANPPASPSQSSGAAMDFTNAPASLFATHPQPTWYPADLGTPNSSGAQNATRYAYFAGKRRLAVAVGGRVSLYDTLEHQITGFGQQQGGAGSLSFTSQHGTVDLSALPVVHGGHEAAAAPGSSGNAQASVFEAIAQLSALKDRGILTELEFAAKKAELLARV